MMKIYLVDERSNKFLHFSKFLTLSLIASEIYKLTSGPHSMVRNLKKIIEKKQPLVTSTLKKTANYRYSKEIGTIKLAIVVLGFDMLKKVTLLHSTFFRNELKYLFTQHIIFCKNTPTKSIS